MNVLATREALERFAHELPAGLAGDRLRRLAETARALYDQALGERGKNPIASGWADHDLAVLVAESLGGVHGADPALRQPAETLFLGVRRRLLEALSNDPDDLAAALALALGASLGSDDGRLAEDLAAVTASLSRPQAGPRLVQAATRLVVHAAHSNSKAMEKAATDLAPAVRDAVERLSRRLPEHPDLALDRIRLTVLAARATEGHDRATALSMARALLADHETRFGPSEAQREIVGQVLQLRGKDAAPSDVAKDALALITSDARERALEPRRTTKLLRSVARAGALDKDTAKKVKELIGGEAAGGGGHGWEEAMALVYEALGDEAALVSLSEKALVRDPKDQHAARALFDRLLRNVRQRLPAPFEATVLDLVVQAAPYASLGRLSAEDIDGLMALIDHTFGAERVVVFAKRLVSAKELEGKEFVWRKALAAAERAKDTDALIDLGRRAVQKKSAPAETRLHLARALLERGQDLDEADDALKPLLSERGPHAAEAQSLRQKLRSDSRYRDARLQSLLAFEHQLGIGTEKSFELKVAYTSPSYALAEVAERPAPEFYEHRHLRVMLRPEDLPQGIGPADLKKGDKLTAPVRGQDATFEKDKDNYRIYWVADARAVKFALGADDLEKRLATEEASFGIGSGRPLPLKVAWDGKKQRVTARLLDKGGTEFRLRPRATVEQLPEGMTPQQLGGRGKRLWGVVAKDGDGYVVSGKMLGADPDAPAGATPEPEAADAAAESASDATAEAADATTEAAE
ncbi:MAG: hypothetical protein U1F43_24655 [Myxococcota bacterium]